MIRILDWNAGVYNDTILDTISANDSFESIDELAELLDMNVSTLKYKLKKHRDNGLLVSHRYRYNNFIWCIGSDVGYNSYEALQALKYRDYVGSDIGADVDEDTLISVDVFNDNSSYWEKINRLLKCKYNAEITKELIEYVDKLWEKYNDIRRDT